MDSNFSIFAETAPVKNIMVASKPHSIPVDALKDDLVSSIEEIGPRIDSLKQTLDQIIAQADANTKNVGADLNAELSTILPNMNNIHNISIQTSRRIQALGLNQQTVSTLSIPKQLRPVHDEFFNFKEEFDTSLKNVATLSRTITQKADSLSTTFDNLKPIPQQIEKTINEIAQQININNNNMKAINQMKSKIQNYVTKTHSSITKRFEQKAKEAEALIDELDKKANEGLNSSTQMGEKLQTEKFDIKTSFQELLSEIEKSTNNKLDEVKSQIEQSNRDTTAEINKLHDTLTEELDDLTQDQNDAGVISILDEIEREKELTELEQLIERFNNLKNAIECSKSGKSGPEYEDHQGIWEGKKVIFRCFNDGTFKIQDLPQ